MSPAKKRETSNHVLYDICKSFNEFDCVLSYLFKVALYNYNGHEI